ncbi:MAG: Rid family hydrolase [Aestuariivirga sp.]
MAKQIINIAGVPASPYCSQAVKAGSNIYLSGIVGMDSKTGQLAGPSIQDQTRQSIENCRNILLAAGASLDDVVEVQVLLIHPGDFAGMNEEYLKHFPVNPPARSVSKLGVEIPGLLVSIKMTACP